MTLEHMIKKKKKINVTLKEILPALPLSFHKLFLGGNGKMGSLTLHRAQHPVCHD